MRPLRQITGIEDEFAEVFFSDVRVPADNLIGELSAGWRLVQTTLSYERATQWASSPGWSCPSSGYWRSRARRDGTLLVNDPLVRRKLGGTEAEIDVLRYASLRILSAFEKGVYPDTESSLSKLHYSELDKRIYMLMNEILGPFGRLSVLF